MLKTEKGTVTLENSTLRMTVDCEHGKISEMSNRHAGKPSNQDRDLFLLEAYGHEYRASDFRFEELTKAEDATQELVSLLYSLDEEKIRIKIHLINGKDSLTYLMQVQDKYKSGVPEEMWIRIPLISSFDMEGCGDRLYPPGDPVLSGKGESVMMPVSEGYYTSDIHLPLVVTDRNNAYGFTAIFPIVSDLNYGYGNQNVNWEFVKLNSENAVRNHRVAIYPTPYFSDTFEVTLQGIENGWIEAFDIMRDTWMQNYDFSEYRKPDLQYFYECVVHNFTFLYGSEAFDHKNMRIDAEKLVEQGKKFGGYDTITIWNQYPRLGIDRRSQWDFYDDFPGGRTELRRAVKAWHDAGAYVYLPYIPWDMGMDESEESMGTEFARIAADTDADGYQLDTMNKLPLSFRKKLNAVRPGIILTTQAHPEKKLPIEMITTSWDELWRRPAPMPEADIYRFVLPFHMSPVISRWLKREGKTAIINRALFNAAPIVIWQDIFGRWNPFDDEQKRRIASWKETYLRYRSIYQGSKPTPLCPVFEKDIYCNRYVADDGTGTIYAFYNDSCEGKTLSSFPLMRIEKDRTPSVIIGNAKSENNNGKLSVTLPSKQVVHVLLK